MMSVLATPYRESLCQEITDTLGRLRDCRTHGDKNKIAVAQNRLDWLLDRLTALGEEEG